MGEKTHDRTKVLFTTTQEKSWDYRLTSKRHLLLYQDKITQVLCFAFSMVIQTANEWKKL